MKTHIFFFAITLSFAMSSKAQQVEREVIAAEGQVSTLSSGVEVSYTVGEPYVGSFGLGTIVLQQGFQQGFEALATSWEPALEEVSFNAYPNPSQGKININLSSNSAQEVHLTLFDLMGRKVLNPVISPLQTSHQLTLDLSHLPAGEYALVCTNAKSQLLKAATLQVSP